MIRSAKLLIISSAVLFCQCVNASVIIDGTRVVYPQAAREVTIQLHNTGDTPSLIQSWVDQGDKNATPDTSNAPFIITPPIARIEAGSGQALRLTFTGKELSPDRETLFWLNVLEVPPSPANAESQNLMQLAFRSRLKIFFRPDGLPGRANKASQSLQCGFEKVDRVLSCSNPTPYHISVVSMEIMDKGNEREIIEKGFMFLPFSKKDFSLNLKNKIEDTSKVIFTSINDFGGAVEEQIDISTEGKKP